MLEVHGIDVYYGDAQALWDVSLQVGSDEIVSIVGPNGAGKTTLVKAIAGILKPRRGQVRFNGTDLTAIPPYEVCRHGVALVPEGRRIFPRLTVRENLEIGAYAPDARSRLVESMESVFAIFPRLRERIGQLAGTLSGGEQQMLAIGRALMAKPKLLLMDEPSLGLAPLVVSAIFDIIRTLNAEGIAVLLVEQHVAKALAVAHRAYILEEGRIVAHGTPSELLNDTQIKRAYLAYV